ncbi:MAG: PQQ-like beta-propeller repeat protein [Spirochaetales bacterium]|nr:PQQ-like beta-propeller repeat protein [Spirochaetales bacterium]
MKKEKVTTHSFQKILFVVLFIAVAAFFAKDFAVPYGNIRALHVVTADRALLLCDINTFFSGVFELSLVDRQKTVFWRTILPEQPVGNGIMDGIAVNGSSVFVRLQSSIAAYSMETGEELWRVEKKILRDTPKYFTILVHENQLFSCYTPRNGERDILFCLDTSTGELFWEQELAANSFPAEVHIVKDYLVYSYLFANKVFVRNRNTGELIKTIDGEDKKPILESGLVFFITNIEKAPILNIDNLNDDSRLKIPLLKLRTDSVAMAGAGTYNGSYLLFFQDTILCLQKNGSLSWKRDLEKKLLTDPIGIRFAPGENHMLSGRLNQFTMLVLENKNTDTAAVLVLLDCQKGEIIQTGLSIKKTLVSLFRSTSKTMYEEITDFKRERWLHIFFDDTMEQAQLKLGQTQAKILPNHVQENYLWLSTRDHVFFPFLKFDVIDVTSLEKEKLRK